MRLRTILIVIAATVVAGFGMQLLVSPGETHPPRPDTHSVPKLNGPIPSNIDSSPKTIAALVALLNRNGYSGINCETLGHEVDCDATSSQGVPTNLAFEFGHHTSYGWTSYG
jgi:hypothetical protein